MNPRRSSGSDESASATLSSKSISGPERESGSTLRAYPPSAWSKRLSTVSEGYARDVRGSRNLRWSVVALVGALAVVAIVAAVESRGDHSFHSEVARALADRSDAVAANL